MVASVVHMYKKIRSNEIPSSFGSGVAFYIKLQSYCKSEMI